MNLKDTSGLFRYLHACFAHEYANGSDVRMGGSRVKARVDTSLETMACGMTPVPWLPAHSAEKLTLALEAHARGTSTLYALLPISVPGERFEAPLLFAMLDSWSAAEAQPQETIVKASLEVNRVLLERMLDDDAADALANAVQGIVDSQVLDREGMAMVLDLLANELPALTPVGFDSWPVLPVRSTASTDKGLGGDNPVLHAAASILLVQRSRRSTGILHELEQLAESARLSAPLSALTADRSSLKSSISTSNEIVQSLALRCTGALSAAQRRAVQGAREQTLSIVFGPPGTGKTHTLAMIVADTVARGGSVLVCSKSQAAAEVVANFLDVELGLEGAVLRGGNASRLSNLKRQLHDVVNTRSIGFTRPRQVLLACRQAEDIDQALLKATHQAMRGLNRQDRSLAAMKKSWSRWSKILWWQKVVSLLRRETRQDTLLKILAQWDQLKLARDVNVLDALQLVIEQRTRQSIAVDRRSLINLADSVAARERRQRELQGTLNYEPLLASCPVWVTTLDELTRLVPMQVELFDLLLIDEASQVDAASALPALQRAGRAVLFGDAEQLRHISFLPQSLNDSLRERFAPDVADTPDFRRDSLLDWVDRSLSTADAANALDEHFRSAPQIIGFSNRSFYGGRLQLLTRVTLGRSPGALQLVEVANAHRAPNGVNRVEADAMLATLQSMVSESGKALGIGLISPFRAQVEYLQKRIDQTFDAATRDRHNMIVGTAHELQGEERDVVLFSCCVDDASSGGSLAFLSRSDVLNVSITRARRQQWVFLSRSPERINPDTLFGQYLDWINSPRLHSDALVERDILPEGMTSAIACSDTEVELNVEVGRLVLDAVLHRGDSALGIDFMDSPDREPFALDDHAMLARIGVRVLPVTIEGWQQQADMLKARVDDVLFGKRSVDKILTNQLLSNSETAEKSVGNREAYDE
ncbi:DEAD/DEAH box helicase [Granulosicoccus antarcticus]|uniref:ATP-dependent RecD-like DNA helicase n=1 Tax=Granulosicoccus antarcticus IMCC3135 TaxID=1192854 RepID=A0A2Z2NYH0_9GAMM|nr:ATP-binding protein [Granulosicoccus antarcticus]ASJ74808.1 ATP-dependent RecD-like DNA helicase [Granulosicoccus antarcticus IMCC3135]